MLSPIKTSIWVARTKDNACDAILVGTKAKGGTDEASMYHDQGLSGSVSSSGHLKSTSLPSHATSTPDNKE